MDKSEYRAVIKFLTLEGETRQRIHERMCAVYGESAPSYATIKRWVREFKQGRESLKDDPHPGRPATATSQGNIDKVHQMVLENRRISTAEIEQRTTLTTYHVVEQ